MRQYLELTQKVLIEGNHKTSRTGIDTRSIFAQELTIDVSEQFPLLTTKKIIWKHIVIEMLWFLGKNFYKSIGSHGKTFIQNSAGDFLDKHGVKFWNHWKNENGQLPAGYADSWRNYIDWDRNQIDQIEDIVKRIKDRPDDRRLVLLREDPSSIRSSHLPACFYTSIFNVGFKDYEPVSLNLHNIGRSVDVGVGLPYNIAGFSLLLHLMSRLTGLQPGICHFSMTDCHVYLNQEEELIKQVVTREPRELPTLEISDRIKTLKDIDDLIINGTTKEIMDCFKLIGYNPYPPIKLDVAV